MNFAAEPSALASGELPGEESAIDNLGLWVDAEAASVVGAVRAPAVE